jgi:hypothetical protein
MIQAAHSAIALGANALRNIVVHAGGWLSDKEGEAVNQFVRRCGSLRGAPGGPVSIQAGFVPEVAATIRRLFIEFENEMQRYMGNEA